MRLICIINVIEFIVSRGSNNYRVNILSFPAKSRIYLNIPSNRSDVSSLKFENRWWKICGFDAFSATQYQFPFKSFQSVLSSFTDFVPFVRYNGIHQPFPSCDVYEKWKLLIRLSIISHTPGFVSAWRKTRNPAEKRNSRLERAQRARLDTKGVIRALFAVTMVIFIFIVQLLP